MFHVIPIDDLYEHEVSAQCWCLPTTESETVIVHNAADEREKYELGERRVN